MNMPSSEGFDVTNLSPELLQVIEEQTKVQQEQANIAPIVSHSIYTADNGIIARFNAVYTMDQAIEQDGRYRRVSEDVYLFNGSTSGMPGGHKTKNGKFFTFHQSDTLLCDGNAHDSFDIYRLCVHGGDYAKAVEGAANLLDPEGQKQRRFEHVKNQGTPTPSTDAKVPPESKYGGPPRVKSMTELLSTTFAPIRWVIVGLLAEGLAILSGAPKIGKSWIVMLICLAKALGGFALGKFKVEPGEVLLLSLEDNERRLQDRLKKCLGNSNPNLDRFHAVTSWRRLDQGGLDDLRLWLEEHPDCCLVVIDTIQKIKPRGRKNANAYESDYEIFGELQKLALSFCCCILIIHHNRKSDSKNTDDPLEQISGSIGITGSMDTILMIKKPRGSNDAILTATGRDIPEAQYAMTFNDGQWLIAGEAATLGLGDNAREIIEILKSHKGYSLTVEQVNELLTDKMEIGSLKTKLYRLANKKIISANKGKFFYIDPDTYNNVSNIGSGDTGANPDKSATP